MDDDNRLATCAVGELTVFFPFFNEEGNIERVVGDARGALERLGMDYEMILVDDGSADRTGEIADALATGDSRVRVVHHERNLGYGMALRSGFAAASKPWVFYTDGDGQFDMNQLDRLLPLAGRVDIVSGYRVRRQDGLMRRVNGRCWSWLAGRALGFRVRDVDSGFKLYRREIFDRIELASTGALIDAEILARAVRAGYTIGEVGVDHLPRVAGRQTGANLAVILRAFKELWRLRKRITNSTNTTPPVREETRP